MSNVQKMLAALGAALHDNQISEDMCEGLILAMNGIPEEYHMPAFEAMLNMRKEDNIYA